MLLARAFLPLLLLIPAAASAQSMNAETFYDRARALKAKGPLAFLSRDLKPLIREARAAGLKVRSARLAAIEAGRRPRYCPPKGSKRLGHEEFLAKLGAIPSVERARINMTEATARIMVSKFPCRD